MAFSYLEFRDSKDQNSFDTGADDAVFEEFMKRKDKERDADREASDEASSSKEKMAEVFGLSSEEFEQFIEQATCFEFDGSKLVARPV